VRSDSSRALRINASVNALHDLMQIAARSPGNFAEDAGFVASLASQGAFAKLSDESRGILACSLNAQKAAADEVVAGGYSALDALRLSLRDAIHKLRAAASEPKKGTKADLILELQESRAETQQVLEDLVLLQRAFDLRCAQARRYAEASKDASLIALSKKEQREIEAGLSRRHRAPPTNNISHLPTKK